MMTIEFHYSILIKEDHWMAVVEMNKKHSIIINNNNTRRHRHTPHGETAKRAFYYSMMTKMVELLAPSFSRATRAKAATHLLFGGEGPREQSETRRLVEKSTGEPRCRQRHRQTTSHSQLKK